MTLWALRRAGLGRRDATRTLLTFLVLLYAVFFGSIAVAGGALALGLGDGYAAGRVALAAGVAGSAPSLAIGSRAAAAPAPPAPGGRIARAAGILGDGVRDAVVFVRSADRACSARRPGGPSTQPCCRACSTRFGAPPALAVVVLAYFVGRSPTRSRSPAR